MESVNAGGRAEVCTNTDVDQHDPKMKQMRRHNYFAYGSNMNPTQMGTRCPAAIALGVVTLQGWDIAINERGVATILPAGSSDESVVVEGVLWSVTDRCLETLDSYEGVREAVYRREEVRIVAADEDGTAIAYVASSRGHGEPRAGYLETILEGADHFKVSPAYRIRLERLSSVQWGKAELRAERPLSAHRIDGEDLGSAEP